MNTCKWNIGLLEGKPILCGKPIMKKYTFCYGHEMRNRKETPLTKVMAEALKDINEQIDPQNRGVETLSESIK